MQHISTYMYVYIFFFHFDFQWETASAEELLSACEAHNPRTEAHQPHLLASEPPVLRKRQVTWPVRDQRSENLSFTGVALPRSPLIII